VLACGAGLKVTAFHVDHGLRSGSVAEADVVADAARRFGARFVRRAVEVPGGPNLEARARAARYSALPQGVLTGHTTDDQAETILLNMVRGAGLSGLAGIRPGPTKPLLGLRRAETRALCDEFGLQPVVDPSNADPTFRRNRVRHELIPLLDAIAQRDVAGLIARQAEWLRDDSDLLDALAAGVDPLDAASLSKAAPPIARRAIRRWLANEAGSDELHPPDAATVARVLAVARGEAVACELAGGWRVSRSGGRLALRHE
jgi:tRNA(Ile)-lysidine synthase